MRVAIVSESFLPQVNGVSNTVRHVVDQLIAAGHEPLVIAPGPGTGAPRRRTGGAGAVAGAARLQVVPARHAGRGGGAGDRHSSGRDVVHLASPICLGAVGLRAARRLGHPDGRGLPDRHRRVRPAVRRPRRPGRRHVGRSAAPPLRPDAGAVADVVRPARGARRPEPARVAARRLARPVRPGAPRPGAARTVVAASDRRRRRRVRRPARRREAGTPPRRPRAGPRHPAGDGRRRAGARLARGAAAGRDVHRHARRRRAGAGVRLARRVRAPRRRPRRSARPCRRRRPAAYPSSPPRPAARSTWSSRARPGCCSTRPTRRRWSTPSRPSPPTPRLRDRVAGNGARALSPPGPGRTWSQELVERALPRALGRSPASTHPAAA